MNWQEIMAVVVVGIAVVGIGRHWRRRWVSLVSREGCHGCYGCSGPGFSPKPPGHDGEGPAISRT